MRRALIIPIATLGIATVVTIVTIVGTGQPAPRQGLPAGQRVSLVARDLDIPAHAAPGDAPVPFRFRGGSFARILSVDEDSGWVQLRGERADGEEAVGWVVPRPTNPPRQTICASYSGARRKGRPTRQPTAGCDWPRGTWRIFTLKTARPRTAPPALR